MLIVSAFWCSCCFSLKGCVSQVFSNDDILNMQEWMAVRSITIKGELGWDDMTRTTHSTTQTFNFWHANNPSLLVTHQKKLHPIPPGFNLSQTPQVWQAIISSFNVTSLTTCLPLLCSIPHFAIVSQPTPSNTNHLALTTWHHPQPSTQAPCQSPKLLPLFIATRTALCGTSTAGLAAAAEVQAWQEAAARLGWPGGVTTYVPRESCPWRDAESWGIYMENGTLIVYIYI